MSVVFDPLRDSRHRDARSARDIADWLAWLEVGNKATRTLDTYERYAATLARNFPLKEFSEFTDGDLLHVLKQHPQRSRHIVKAAWNSWFKWGYKTRRIPGNPVDLLPTIKYKPDRHYQVFPEADAEALCALPSPHGSLMTILFWTGIRRAEARNLTGKRIDLAQAQLIVKEGAKGSKTRAVPLTSRALAACSDLLLLEGIGPHDYLWFDRPGGNQARVRRTQPISDSSFQRWWLDCLGDARVERRKPHMTRHTYATRLRQLGVPMEDIQAHLGHESLSITSDTYVHSDSSARAERLRLAVGDPV